METPQPDKTGMHILLKLASLVVILAGIHAAADIIVQLLLALFFAIVLNPLVTWFIRRGVQRPVAITIVVVVMLIALTALATYTVFMDLSLGVTGPLAGLVMSWAGVPVIYLAAAGLVAIALLLTWRLKKRPPEHVPEAASSS